LLYIVNNQNQIFILAPQRKAFASDGIYPWWAI